MNWRMGRTVDSFSLEQDGKKVYFTAAVDGTKQLLKWIFLGWQNRNPCATGNQGDFDVNDLVGFTSNSIIVSRGDMNHASEFFLWLKENTWKQIHQCKCDDSLALSKTERRYVTTTDGKKMLVWVILPQILMLQKVSNTFILPRRTTKRLDAILFFPLEFSANGRQWLYCCSTKSSRNARPRVGGTNKSVKTGADR
jgi:hypothetical protein